MKNKSRDTHNIISQKVIVIFGPTSSGKTALSFEIADYLLNKFGLTSEIISSDSRQVYKGMSVGTAKVTSAERKRYTHHFIGIAEPTEQYTPEQFAREARFVIDKVHERGHLPLIVGGTGTYVMGLVGEKHLEKAGESKTVSYDSLVLVPDFNRQKLYRKIEANVDRMFQAGLYGEVRSLIAKYHAVPKQIGKTHGYREFVEYAKRHKKNVFRLNEIDLAKINHLIKVDTKKYAMHQSSWLVKMKNYHLVKNAQEAIPPIEEFLQN